MCKHIHLLNRYLKANPSTNRLESEEDVEDELLIDTDELRDQHNAETEAHITDFSKHNTTAIADQDVRKFTTDCLEKAISLATDEASRNTLISCMKTVLAKMEIYRPDDVDVALPGPQVKPAPNENIGHQLRFYKKSKSKRKNDQPSSADVLADLILPGRILPLNDPVSIK
jgi:nitrogen regulatory protein PII-like uncharacterized protein